MKDFLVYISHRYYLPISIVDIGQLINVADTTNSEYIKFYFQQPWKLEDLVVLDLYSSV